MKKRFYLLCLIFLFLLFLFPLACKSPNSPELPTKDRDTIEFLYERVLPIVFPNNPDPDGFIIFNEDGGGRNPHNWHSVGENKWMAEDELKYTASQYMIWLTDWKVTPIGGISVARKICARIKGSSEWIELTRILPNPLQDGEQAEFILDAQGIHTIF